jgi:hypothetical protein
MQAKTKKNCGRWKSGNPKSGFPLFHRPECLRRKEKNSRLHKTLDASDAVAAACFINELFGIAA